MGDFDMNVITILGLVYEIQVTEDPELLLSGIEWPYPHVEPSKRSVQRLKDRVKQLTDRCRGPVPLDDIMIELNASLRGWTGYFHYRNSSNVFRCVKMQVEERLRTHLRRRHKLQSRGAAYIRFPNHRLYLRYNLFKLPTTAGWKKAHAL